MEVGVLTEKDEQYGEVTVSLTRRQYWVDARRKQIVVHTTTGAPKANKEIVPNWWSAAIDLDRMLKRECGRGKGCGRGRRC